MGLGADFLGSGWDPGILVWGAEIGQIFEFSAEFGWTLRFWLKSANFRVFGRIWTFELFLAVLVRNDQFWHFFLLKIIFGIIYPLEMLFLSCVVVVLCIEFIIKKKPSIFHPIIQSTH